MTVADWMNEIDSVDVDSRAVADALAEQVLRGHGYREAVAHLTAEAERRNELIERLADDGAIASEYDRLTVIVAALRALEEMDAAKPALRGEREGPGRLSALHSEQRKLSENDASADPVKSVLFAPRIRSGLIERVVRTWSGRVATEWHNEFGWRRHTRVSVATVLQGMRLADEVAGAISKSGDLDGLTAAQCHERLVAMDPDADLTGLSEQYAGAQLDPPCTYEAVFRVTSAELVQPGLATDDRSCGGDATTRAIVAELLAITPALWSAVTLAVWAEEKGFHFSIIGNETVAWVEPSAQLRSLVARRFEMMEAVRGEAWHTFSMKVTRTGAQEWRCEVGYTYMA